MTEHWTPEEIQAYERVIKRAPESRIREEVKRRRDLDKLFNRLHGRKKYTGRNANSYAQSFQTSESS